MSPTQISDFRLAPPIQAAIAKFLGLAFLLVFTTSPLHAETRQQQGSMRQSVLALDSARKTAVREIEATALSSNEIDDYKDFVAYLNTRIVNYCRDLAKQGDSSALEGLPCPQAIAISGTGETHPGNATIFYTTGPGFGETRTPTEETAVLDEAFLTSLGEFDETLLKEEDKVAARVPSQRESGSSRAAVGGGRSADSGEVRSGEDGVSVEQGEGGPDDPGREEQVGSPQETTSRSGAQGSGVEQSTYGTPGGELPPPEDDDIVARQLREAAEKEPDPELKMKLWEEYWKYKGVSKQRSEKR